MKRILMVLLPYEFTLLSNICCEIGCNIVSFTTLWIYTTLKHDLNITKILNSFTTLWIYTTLKRSEAEKSVRSRFTTLWIYTTLKRSL